MSRPPSPEPPRSLGSRGPLLAAAIVALVLFGVALVRSTWIGDDPYITLRTIDNFWNGFGLRWNVVERVQGYTHPAWMILVGAVYGVTREPYFTTLGVSWACTVGAIGLIVARLPLASSVPTLLTLTSARAFVDYSTSGLENPLSHLLLTAYCLVLLAPDAAPSARRLRGIGLLASLTALTRLDLLLLVAPGLIAESRRLAWRVAARALAVAAIPLIAWHLFSLIYYGFPFPNTAYAKLGHGMSRQRMAEQGLHYLYESLTTDPVTLITIVLAVAITLATAAVRRSRIAHTPLASGLLLYVAYVVWIGGDFMSGRFLTPVVLCAVLLLAAGVPERSPRLTAAGVVALLVVSLSIPSSPLRIWSPLPSNRSVVIEEYPIYHGILDERAFYYAQTGLIPVLRGERLVDHPYALIGRRRWGNASVVLTYVAGMAGYYAGPAVHVIDIFALTDPLLARLPAHSDARIGHFSREAPAGYIQTAFRCLERRFPNRAFLAAAPSCLELWADVNQIEDPAVGHRYHELLRITQDELFDPVRLWTIVRWNVGFRAP